MQTYTATYSPDDNKLRLYAATRLDADTYARVKGAGFSWAPKQELFVAPMWTPAREDLLLDLAGEIGDEDTNLVDRAEERADRFDDYAGKRAGDADAARHAVAAIADGIPFGQPILVGHHSERHARKDAQRIEDGMRRAVRLWETAGYWRSRAAGAIRAAKYKERPDVRARRIKTIEADQRREQRATAEADRLLEMWRKLDDAAAFPRRDGAETTPRERAIYIANFDHISQSFPLADFPRDPPASQYEGAMGLWSALDGNVITAEQARDIAIPCHERGNARRARWIAHCENRLAYERAMLGEAGGTVADQTTPEKGGACRCWASPRGGWSYIQKVSRVTVTVLDNYGNGGRDFTRLIPLDKLTAIMPAADVRAAREAGRIVEAEGRLGFYLRDVALPERPHEPAAEPADAGDFAAIKATLAAGVKVAVVPQLFPTPLAVAQQMAGLASIQPGHRVLEPSAGTGNLLAAIDRARGYVADREPPCEIVAVEIDQRLVDAIPANLCAKAIRADFLACNGELGTFDRIVMNPPFTNGADIKHILHARGFLRPGGRLVAICADGPRQRETLEPLAAYWEPLAADTFAAEGTAVRTVLLTIEAEAPKPVPVKAQPKPWFAMIEED